MSRPPRLGPVTYLAVLLLAVRRQMQRGHLSHIAQGVPTTSACRICRRGLR